MILILFCVHYNIIPSTRMNSTDTKVPHSKQKNEGTIAPPASRQESKTANVEVSDLNSNNETTSRKDIFKRYLFKSGFKYAIIRAIVALYEDPEKPDDPLSWIFGFLGNGIPTLDMIAAYHVEAQALRKKIETLQQENLQLRMKIEDKETALIPDPMAIYDWKGFLNEATDDEEIADPDIYAI